MFEWQKDDLGEYLLHLTSNITLRVHECDDGWLVTHNRCPLFGFKVFETPGSAQLAVEGWYLDSLQIRKAPEPAPVTPPPVKEKKAKAKDADARAVFRLFHKGVDRYLNGSTIDFVNGVIAFYNKNGFITVKQLGCLKEAATRIPKLELVQ